MKIDGKIVAEEIFERLKNKKNQKKFLAGILVGENLASQKFLEQKKKTAMELGVDFRIYKFAEDISSDELRKEVHKISNHKTCGGVIVQLPLPGHINEQYILNVVPPNKDVDVLGARALGDFYTKRSIVLPPSVETVKEIIKKFPINLDESVVVVVGAGRLIGRPIASWFIGSAKELFVLDKGGDMGLLKRADLVVSGAGASSIIEGEALKKGAGIIDFGYGKTKEGKLGGDLNTASALEHLSFWTPTPGGTGPILVAKILENFFELNEEK